MKVLRLFPVFWFLVAALTPSNAGSETTHSQETPTGTTNQHDYWAVEDPKAREKLPLYKIIPAAKPDELTPANGCPKAETFLSWHRSHGDNAE